MAVMEQPAESQALPTYPAPPVRRIFIDELLDQFKIISAAAAKSGAVK